MKNLPALQETWQEPQVQLLGWEDPLEKKMATHSSILIWISFFKKVLNNYLILKAKILLLTRFLLKKYKYSDLTLVFPEACHNQVATHFPKVCYNVFMLCLVFIQNVMNSFKKKKKTKEIMLQNHRAK